MLLEMGQTYTSDGEVSRILQLIVKLEWLELMFLYLYQWHITVLEDGNNPCMVIMQCMEEGVRFYTKLKTVTSRWPKVFSPD